MSCVWWSLNCRASPAASRPAQPLSCEIQPFTCVLNRFLDKHLQASSCKYIRMSIIFSTGATTFNFLPWELWSTSQKICRKKGTKPIKWQLVFCAFNNTNTLVTENSILTKSSGSHHPLVAANSILNTTFTNISQTWMFQGLLSVTSVLQQSLKTG